MGSVLLAGEYLRKEREWPEVRGNRLEIKVDTRKRSKSAKKQPTSLKIYDGDAADVNEKKSKNSSKQEKAASQGSEDSVEENDEEEAEDSNSDEISASEEE